jgi:hypothetical protein
VIDTCHFHFNLTLFLKTHKIQIVENPAGALGSTGYFGFHTGWNEQAVSVYNFDIFKTEAVKSPPETSQQAEAVKPPQYLVIARGKLSMYLTMLNLVRIVSTRTMVEVSRCCLNAWFVRFVMELLLTTPTLVEDRIKAEE